MSTRTYSVGASSKVHVAAQKLEGQFGFGNRISCRIDRTNMENAPYEQFNLLFLVTWGLFQFSFHQDTCPCLSELSFCCNVCVYQNLKEAVNIGNQSLTLLSTDRKMNENAMIQLIHFFLSSCIPPVLL